MTFSTTVSANPGLHGQLKLARLLEMPEKDVERRVRELESKDVFRQLVRSGALSVHPYSQARFAAQRFAGWGLRTSSEGIPELLDGGGDLAQLMTRIGEELFKECFLSAEPFDDERRAKRCGISIADARRLREFIDRVYVQAEFEDPAARLAPSEVFSAVAGVQLENGRPVLAFFNRDIWKGRYRVEEIKLKRLLETVSHSKARQMRNLVRQLEFLDRRKSTLYQVLEALIEMQKEFFTTGDPASRKPLTQRSLADRLLIAPSVLNRLISNKSIQLPWGHEAPIGILVPSSKSLLRERLHDIALNNPGLSDQGLRGEMSRLGARLSRRSIAQYRKELGLGGAGLRGRD